MPAVRCNYLVLFTNESQVFGTASRDIALSTPPPEGTTIEEKRVLFVSYEPDNEVLSVHPLPLEEVRAAELAAPVSRKKEKNG